MAKAKPTRENALKRVDHVLQGVLTLQGLLGGYVRELTELKEWLQPPPKEEEKEPEQQKLEAEEEDKKG